MPARAETRRFDKGDEVMAKWPKTSLYYKGKVLDFNDVEYLIRFEDEEQSELAIKYKDVTSEFPKSRSQSRGRTPTRKSKSPSRKSPSRKSPSRKSPSRKSPGRKASPPRASRSTTKESNANSQTVKKETESASTTTIRSRLPTAPTRQSARIASIEKISKTTTTATNNIKVDVKSISKSVENQNKIKSYFCRVGKCYLATMKALPMAFMVLFVTFLLNQMCSSKAKCSVLTFPDIPLSLRSYYDQKAASITVGYLGVLLLLSYVPVGKVVRTASGANVRCNGFISLLFCVCLVPALLKMEYKLASLYLLYRYFLASFVCVGLLVSVLLYIKSFYADKDAINPQGNSGYFLPDFVEGREISPRIGNLDIKAFLMRAGLITVAMVNILIVIKDLQTKMGNYSPTLLVACAIQILYVVDFIWFEDGFFTTYESNKQGTGMLVAVGYLSIPFFTAIYTRYIYICRSELPWYCLVGIAGLNLIGYIIIRGSNSQKHAFRSNPADPALAHLESLPTAAGKRLLVSGWWGLVRHPNYLGDIIIQLSWVLLCGFKHAIPWVAFLINVFFLIGRMFIVERECKKKYGLAWSSYTARVPKRVIPKVF